MKNIQPIQDIQQDVIDLKAIFNYKKYGLKSEQSIKQLKGIISNLEEHLNNLIINIYK